MGVPGARCLEVAADGLQHRVDGIAVCSIGASGALGVALLANGYKRLGRGEGCGRGQGED